jgi:putative tricarboxylic transport membrane protein
VRAADAVSALVWLALGAGVAWAGWDLDLGTLRDPGSGFMLVWVGVVMMGLALAVLGGAVRAGAGPGLAALWTGTRWPKVAGVLVALVAYAYALPWLGFLATTALLLVVLFKAVEPQRWSVAIGGAVASAVVAWVVFRLWLGTQLPAGIFDLG